MPGLQSLLVDFTVLMAVLTIAFIGIISIRNELNMHSGLISIVVLFGVLAVPLWWTYGEYGVSKASSLFSLTLLAATAPVLIGLSDRDIDRILSSLKVVALMAAAIAYIFGAITQTGRLAVHDIGPVVTGRTAGIALVVWAISGLQSRSSRVVAIPAIVLTSWVVLSTGTRGPAMGALVAISVVLLRRPRRLLPRALGLALLLLALGRLFWQGPDIIDTRFSRALQGGFVDTWRGSRFDVYAEGFAIVRNHPFGVGWGGAAAHSRHLYPHNIFIEVAAEGGWIVASIFACFIAICAVMAWKLLKTSRHGAMVFALFAYAIAIAQTSGDINGNRLLFFSCGLVISSWHVVRRGAKTVTGVGQLEGER